MSKAVNSYDRYRCARNILQNTLCVRAVSGKVLMILAIIVVLLFIDYPVW